MVRPPAEKFEKAEVITERKSLLKRGQEKPCWQNTTDNREETSGNVLLWTSA